MPMLVIHNEDDLVVDVSQAHRIAAAHGSKARLMTTHGLGHHRILADPVVVEQIVDFVAAAEVTPVAATTETSEIGNAGAGELATRDRGRGSGATAAPSWLSRE
jgi:hypothetical protein